MRSFRVVLLLTFFFPLVLFSQTTFKLNGELRSLSENADRPLSNSGVVFYVRGDSVWFGTGKGLDLTTDGGSSWRHLGDEPTFNNADFDHNDISALSAYGSTYWAALAGSEPLDDGSSLPKGLGLVMSTDNGATWKHIAQPMEAEGDSTYVVQYGVSRLKALSVTTPIQNITYDLAATSNAVYTTSFAGGLRKSTDMGATFHLMVLPPDNLDSISISDTVNFDLSPVDRPDRWNLSGTVKGMRGNFNHRVFSVLAVTDSELWVGTAGGINRTTDGGNSWRKFSYTNQANPISGNFVVAIGRNVIGGTPFIWAATINANDPQEFRAISFTSDQGRTWSTALRGEFTHNFGFMNSVVYAVSNTGVFRSDNAGLSWTHYTGFVDTKHNRRSYDDACYAVASQGDTIWVANVDGLMNTRDNSVTPFGSDWTIFRAAAPLASAKQAYAYPNPFSPDDEVCRIHYRTTQSGSVSIRVFDFAMFPVRTIIQNASRTPSSEIDDIWDGKDDNRKQVANGLYYIKVTQDGEDVWTKIIVLQ